MNKPKSDARLGGCTHRITRSILSLGLLVAGLTSAPVATGQTLQYVPVITTYAGGTAVCSGATNVIGDGCLATQAIVKTPWSSTSDGAGNFYFSDSGSNVIRRVDAKTGIITTVAGGASAACSGALNSVGDGCPALQSTLNGPAWVRFDAFGNMVIADRGNNRVRSVSAKTGIITTTVGTGVAGSTAASNTKPLASAATACSNPTGLAFDRAGNLYVTCSSRFYVALVVAVNGVIDGTTSLMYDLAGTGTTGYKGDGGPGPSALLNGAQGLSIDAAGNVYIGDYQNYVVRKVTSPFQNGTLNLNGAIISTFAGTSGTAGNSGDGGLATAAVVGNARDANVDNAGKIYISSYQISGGTGGDKIRVVDPTTKIVSTLAGTSTRATSGDGGPAILGAISGPYATSFDNQGSAYIDAYVGNNVRRVSLDDTFFAQAVGAKSTAQNVIAQATSSVTLQTAAITSSNEFALGTLNGCAIASTLAAQAYCTLPVSFAPSLPGYRTGRLTLSDGSSNISLGLSGFGSAPLPVFSAATIVTVAGTGTAGSGGASGPATAAQLNAPGGGVFDSQGNLFLADTGNNTIRKITTSGTISTVAGTGASGYTGDGAAATAATLRAPAKVAMDAAGNLYIADTGNNVIRFVNVDTGFISTIAGNGTAAYTGDAGPPVAAALNHPQGVAVDAGGNVYVADTGNNVIRRFIAGGVMITLAGTGTAGFAGDGGAPALAQLNAPSSVTLDYSGNLYIADTGNAVVRDINPFGNITTVAGTAGGTTNLGDGSLATSASLLSPTDAAVDAGGALYIAAGNVVRVVNSAGVISTYAGTGASGNYSGDNGASTAAALGSSAKSLFLDGSSNLYIAATSSNRLLEVTGATTRPVTFGATVPGSTSSPQTVVLSNTGSSNLVLTGLSVSTGYSLQTSASNACASTTVVAPGGSCVLNITFQPATTGTFTGSITINDNALNVAGSIQSISLTGVARVINVTATAVTVAPTSLTYGVPAVATATVSGGVGITGNVLFALNGTTVATVALSGGKASTTLSTLSVGTSTVTASYQGDDNNASSAGSQSVSVQPATLTVTATNLTRASGTPNPTLAYTITGFVNGESASVVSGTPVLSTIATQGAPEGTYPITISKGTLSATNYNFVLVNGTLTITTGSPYGYTLTPAAPILNVRPIESAVEVIALTPVGGFTGTITFGCSGAPAGYTCTVNPTSVTMNGTVVQTTQVTLYSSTKAALSEQPVFKRSKSLSGLMTMALTLPFAFSWAWSRKRHKINLQRPALLFAISVFIGSVVVGCGQTSNVQKYTIKITATDGTATPRVVATSFEVDIAN